MADINDEVYLDDDMNIDPGKPYVDPEDRILTIPNLITAVRLLLIPVFLILYVYTDQFFLALAIYTIAACTDWVDGYVARRTNSVSNFGKSLDPLADRLLIIFGIIGVYVVEKIPLWTIVAVLGRDFIMLILTGWLERRGETFTVAYIGKIATWIVMTSFGLIMLGWCSIPGLGIFDASWLPGFGSTPACLGMFVLYVGIIIQWITAIVYIVRVLHHGTTRKVD